MKAPKKQTQLQRIKTIESILSKIILQQREIVNFLTAKTKVKDEKE